MLFLQLKRHDFELLLNCQRTKLQNSSWEYIAENFFTDRFIIMYRCKIVKCVYAVEVGVQQPSVRDWRGGSSEASGTREAEWSAEARNPAKPDPREARGTP